MSVTTALSSFPAEESDPVQKEAAADLRRAAIRAGVLKALGVPAHLFRVSVKPLWGNHFRVNVVTGEHSASVNIPNSYFVTADEAGTILASEPGILKQY